jgi:hypothetical protein
VATKWLTAAVIQVANKMELVVLTTKTQNATESFQAKIVPTQQKDVNFVNKEHQETSVLNALQDTTSSIVLASVDVLKDTFLMTTMHV